MQIDKLQMFGKEMEPKRVRLTPAGPVFEEEGDSPKLRSDGALFGDPSDSDGIDRDWEFIEGGKDGGERAKTPAHGTYILSVVGRGQTKTLHRIGECHRIPGVHYSKFEVVGDNPPPPSKFHRSCQICFPRGAGAGEEGSSGEAEDSDVTSSDSSTSVEGSSEDD